MDVLSCSYAVLCFSLLGIVIGDRKEMVTSSNYGVKSFFRETNEILSHPLHYSTDGTIQGGSVLAQLRFSCLLLATGGMQ